jgi:hypothetical protein
VGSLQKNPPIKPSETGRINATHKKTEEEESEAEKGAPYKARIVEDVAKRQRSRTDVM